MNVVPRALREVGVLVEPLTIAEKSLLQVMPLQERLPWACPHVETEGWGHCHSALVLGAGPVGLLGAMALAVRGFETTVYSREPDSSAKASLVRSFGGRYVSAAERPLETLAEITGRVDVIYEATGISRLAFDSLRCLAPNGVLVLTGVPALRGPAPIDTDALMRSLVLGNQLVLGTVNAGRDAFEAAIRDLGDFTARWPEAVRGLITGRYPLEAHRDLLLGPLQGIKNVIAFEGRA
jgi:threonine dehydrogenase-like Zn-dependent dehydrogenase